MRYVYDDGGRLAAGYSGDTGDCVCRAISIATGKKYQEVYDALHEHASKERPGSKRRKGKRSHPRTGVFKVTRNRYLKSLGWQWYPTMNIGTGCTVHLRDGELPDKGRLLVSVSRHLVAVIDGVIHDTHDPSRGGTRCVYGYWRAP
jgi:hypothetical protein